MRFCEGGHVHDPELGVQQHQDIYLDCATAESSEATQAAVSRPLHEIIVAWCCVSSHQCACDGSASHAAANDNLGRVLCARLFPCKVLPSTIMHDSQTDPDDLVKSRIYHGNRRPGPVSQRNLHSHGSLIVDIASLATSSRISFAQ